MSNTDHPIYTADHPDITIIDPKIIVFHNVISDCNGFIDFYETQVPWGGWYGFGAQAEAIGSGLRTDGPEFPSWDKWQYDIINAPIPDLEYDPYRQELAAAFYHASKFYVEHTEHAQPNWVVTPWSLARYVSDTDIIGDANLTMNYHTDYMPDDAETPGEKFGITAVFYPNDDYEGGEISFRLIGDGGVLKEFDYKPKAGDLVMFPSKHPYYHGVKRISGSPKYISRLYWLYDYEGSSDWNMLKEKYGPQKFAELEHQRRKRSDLMIMKPYMRPRFTLKEYYELLESDSLLPVYYDSQFYSGEDV